MPPLPFIMTEKKKNHTHTQIDHENTRGYESHTPPRDFCLPPLKDLPGRTVERLGEEGVDGRGVVSHSCGVFWPHVVGLVSSAARASTSQSRDGVEGFTVRSRMEETNIRRALKLYHNVLHNDWDVREGATSCAG